MFGSDGSVDILVIPDAHADPGQDLWRFDAIGRMAASLRPHVLLSIGDWASFASLSRHANAKEREGQRYVDEVLTARTALDRMEAAMLAAAPDYRPRKVITLGNHCEYPERLTGEHTALIGAVSSDAMGFRERGWEVYPFRQPVEIAGILFCHYFENAAGRPIGGKYQAGTVLAALHQSAVFGHSHRVNYATDVRGNGTRMHSLCVGVYSDAHFDYAGEQGNRAFWRGAWMLRHAAGGDFDPQAWRLDTIRRMWG